MQDTNIVRYNGSGFINTVNDTEPGGGLAYGPTQSLAGGQLGAGQWLDDSEIVADTTVGTVYGGHFRYVRLAAGATAVVRGQLVFWDDYVSYPDNKYQVTTSEVLASGSNAMVRAGVVLNPSWTAGNYSWIQDIGPVAIKFRGTLTNAGTEGCACFAAAVGAGADNGLADVLTNASAVLFSDAVLLLARYLGVAAGTPTSGGTTVVYLQQANVRG